MLPHEEDGHLDLAQQVLRQAAQEDLSQPALAVRGQRKQAELLALEVDLRFLLGQARHFLQRLDIIDDTSSQVGALRDANQHQGIACGAGKLGRYRECPLGMERAIQEDHQGQSRVGQKAGHLGAASVWAAETGQVRMGRCSGTAWCFGWDEAGLPGPGGSGWAGR